MQAIKNITAERIVISSILAHPEWILEIDGLQPDHFFATGHKTIYYLVSRLVREGVEVIDSMAILALAERIDKAMQILNENGGIEYLEALRSLAEDYKLDDLQRYANEVITCAYKREQSALLENHIQLLQEKTDWNMAKVDSELTESLRSLQSRYRIGSDMQTIGQVFEDVWNEVKSNRSGNGIVGLPSKIPMVNDYFTYRNGELVIIGARPKYGKSNYAMNEAHFLAVENGIPVGILDTEMKTRTFLARLIALDSGVPTRSIESGLYESDPDLRMRVEVSIERIKKSPIVHQYLPYWDRAKVSSAAKLLQARHGIGMLIYDYIKVKEVGSNVKEHSELGNWTIFLKDLAGDLDIPILSFAQLSQYELRLADSDKINRYASTIAYLLPKTREQIVRDLGEEEGGADYMFVDFNRNGPSMSDPEVGINLVYDRRISKFEQAPYQPLRDDDGY